MTFCRKLLGVGTFAVAALAATSIAVAQSPGVMPPYILHMQTAFNPQLPGAGEAVRTFTKTLKHISAGALSLKIIEAGKLAPTRDMLDAIVSGDLEAAFTWSGYAAEKAPVLNTDIVAYPAKKTP